MRLLAFLAALLLAPAAALATPRPVPPAPTVVQTVPSPPARPPVRLDRTPEVRPDPAVRRGVLPNGVRYAVMRNANPGQAVAMRLHIDVGSFEESEAERGAAHFLEHMAFNGTRAFPEGELDTVFSAQGVAFGRDQNAYTSHFSTVYTLDLPLADAAKLDLGFKWLRDVADAILLEPAAVERERGVVLAEHDRGLGPARTFAEAQALFLSPELRGPTRWPIGVRETLNRMNAATLRAFYDRWYRPEHAVVTVVGDFPVAELEARVGRAFGSWRARGPAPVRAPRGAPRLDRGLDVLVRAEPQLPTGVLACRPRLREPARPETVARWRRSQAHGVWQAVLNDRLSRLLRSGTPPFLNAAASEMEVTREASYTCVTATPVDDDWRRALDTALTEVRRMELHGVSADEVVRALAQRREGYRAAAAAGTTRPSAMLANQLMSDLADEAAEVFSTPEENLRVFEAAVADLTAAEVNAAFRHDWSGGEPLISVRAPEPPGAAAVRAAWTTAYAASPSPPAADLPRNAWAYPPVGPAGRIARRETIADPGFTRVVFENGVIVNLKQVAFTRDRVDVGVRLGAGRSGLPFESTAAPVLATRLFAAGGLGRHDITDLRSMFGVRRWSMDLDINNTSYDLHGATSPADLELQLQLLSAYLTDPGFRPEVDARIPTAARLMERTIRTSPALVSGQALLAAIAPGHPSTLPPASELAKLRARDFERLLKPVVTTAPLEATIVGDVDEELAIAAAARSLGALPPRTGAVARSARPPFLNFPGQPTVVRATHEGAPEKAMVSVIWPLYVATPERRREERALEVVSAVFNEAVRRRIREALGKSYAPGVGLSMPDYADQGTLTASVETASADVEAVGAEIRKLAAELAAGGITQAAIDQVRKPRLDGAAKQRETNGWWFSTLSGSARNPEWLQDALHGEDQIRSLSREEVQRAAATWLSRTPTVVFAVPQAPASAAAPVRPAAR